MDLPTGPKAPTVYSQIAEVAAMPDVALAIERVLVLIDEGGFKVLECGKPTTRGREEVIRTAKQSAIRSILMYGACACFVDGDLLPHVLVPGVDGEFKQSGSTQTGYKTVWVPTSSKEEDTCVTVTSFNPNESTFRIVSCVSTLVPAASMWGEIMENYLAADFSNSFTSYVNVLRNAGVITSEASALRGASVDNRSAALHLVSMSMRAQTSGRTMQGESLMTQMNTLLESIRSTSPPGRAVHRVSTQPNGSSDSVKRVIPGSAAIPLMPGFGTEPVSTVTRNPHLSEIRTNFWLLAISAAFGIPPTRLFGHRGPWDTGNLSHSSSNTQMEAAFRMQVCHFRDALQQVFSDLSYHARIGSVVTEVRWSLIPTILRQMTEKNDPRGLLTPYVDYLRRSGKAEEHQTLALVQTETGDAGEKIWSSMLDVLASEIQADARLNNVVLDHDPVVKYLRDTRASAYDKWITEYTQRTTYVESGRDESSGKEGLIGELARNIRTGDAEPPNVGRAREVEQERKTEPKDDGCRVYEIVWNREPGMANLLLALCEQGYVNPDAAMRMVLPSLGFSNPEDVEKLLSGTSRTKRRRTDDEDGGAEPQFAGPATILELDGKTS